MAYDIEGGASSLYDMNSVRLAGLAAAVTSETPPGVIVMFLGCARFSKDVISVAFRVITNWLLDDTLD